MFLISLMVLALPTFYFVSLLSSEDNFKQRFFYTVNLKTEEVKKEKLYQENFISTKNVKSFVKNFVVEVNSYERNNLENYNNKIIKMFTKRGYEDFWPKFLAKYQREIDNNMYRVTFTGQKYEPVLVSSKQFGNKKVWNFFYSGIVTTKGLQQSDNVSSEKTFFIRVVTVDNATNSSGIGVDSYFIR